MVFAQLAYPESLRDIEACLRSIAAKLYHMGFRCKVARSSLADANEFRDWRIFADVAQVLIRIARPLYAHDPIGVDLDETPDLLTYPRREMPGFNWHWRESSGERVWASAQGRPAQSAVARGRRSAS
jgi:hypothetical protein